MVSRDVGFATTLALLVPPQLAKPPLRILPLLGTVDTQARTRGFFFTTFGIVRTGFLGGFASVFFD